MTYSQPLGLKKYLRARNALKQEDLIGLRRLILLYYHFRMTKLGYQTLPHQEATNGNMIELDVCAPWSQHTWLAYARMDGARVQRLTKDR